MKPVRLDWYFIFWPNTPPGTAHGTPCHVPKFRIPNQPAYNDIGRASYSLGEQTDGSVRTACSQALCKAGLTSWCSGRFCSRSFCVQVTAHCAGLLSPNWFPNLFGSSAEVSSCPKGNSTGLGWPKGSRSSGTQSQQNRKETLRQKTC